MAGPNMLFTTTTSVLVTGKFEIILELTMLAKSFGDGYPTMPSARLATLARSYSQLVYPSQFSFTLFTMMITRSVVAW
jgi:hypothetical protein